MGLISLAARRAIGRRAKSLAVKPKARMPDADLAARVPVRREPQKALPAPPKRLALPPPGPGLPPHAAKPRGGQWWADDTIQGSNFSPEAAVRGALRPRYGNVGYPAEMENVQAWLQKALPKYLKTDFAAPTDPLRDLAERGLLHIPEIDADRWSRMAGDSFIADRIGQDILLPNTHSAREGGLPGAGSDLRGEAMVKMPWLAKQPMTDNIYGMSPTSLRGLEFDHVRDELLNAMTPGGLPPDLAVRPEALERMSFAQGVERVGRINQWRAKQMETEQLAALDSPAVHLFKEYPDDPKGMRWVELRKPQSDNVDPEALASALRLEGDTMGHCVGGYCPDVESGRSRIYSLRDAKGYPHVTVETSPNPLVYSDLVRHLGGDESLANDYLVKGYQAYAAAPEDSRKGALMHALELAGVPRTEDIVQIKGKQNRKPVDDYIPYVQDFVKSQQWGNVGDLGNTDLVRLPDGRYIRNDQWREGIAKAVGARNPAWSPERLQTVINDAYASPGGLVEDRWASDYAPYFEGFAIGGRVSADRDFSRNPLAARIAA